MKKVAIVLVLAVFVPCLVLAGLALRSLRDQQFVLERQQALLYQSVADHLARETQRYVAGEQKRFAAEVEALLAGKSPINLAPAFDDQLRGHWPSAEIGFAVSIDGSIFSPSLFGRPEARRFRLENDRFLSNRETVEVYWNKDAGANSDSPNEAPNQSQQQSLSTLNQDPVRNSRQSASYENKNQSKSFKRNVTPQKESVEAQQSSIANATEAEFHQLIGDSNEGTLARFLQNKLNLLIWYRSARDPKIIFGAQLDSRRLVQGLKPLFETAALDPALRPEICVALMDDTGTPVSRSHPNFRTDWKRPFVATGIGDMLPHWEAAVYLLNPAKLTASARTVRLTIGLLVAALLLAVGIGGWLIVLDLRRQLALARQKTDFVSNVSHELKTPLTSIRMFSELLAENRVADPEKQRSYLHIIGAETARLTRLINNVLDFSRMERGEKKYDFQPVDLRLFLEEIVESYRPHLEANGFTLDLAASPDPLIVQADRDALSQIILNLLSNAEKYVDQRKEIRVETGTDASAVEIRILDRGLGIPAGCEEKIFQQFFRAHDSLSSGIQGSGLGLTLARQIIRAHGGEISCRPREQGGTCFIVRLPLSGKASAPANERKKSSS